MPKIVIVEDESIVAVDLKMRLEGLGYEVVSHVMTGEDAMISCRNHHPDLLLLDIHLKGDIDGIETAHRLKEFVNIPIIFITAYTDHETLTRAKMLEPFGYIIKPIQERELASTIELALYKHRMQQELEEKEALFEVTLGAVTDGLISINENNKVLFQNEISKRLVGAQTMCPDIFDHVEKQVHPDVDREVTYTKFSRTPVEILQQKSKNHSLTIIIIRDISQSLVSEAQLVQSRRLAEDVSQAKSNFMANMSHELRTPLNSIIGMTDLVLESVDDREIIEYLNISKRASEGLLSLINSILDYSKIEAGRMDLYQVPFDLDEIIENVLQKIAIDAYKKDLELKSNIATPLTHQYIGDPKRVFQILLNLLWNAVKFTNSGSISVTRRLAEDTSTYSVVEIEISDTGVGILPDKVESIFNAFTQQDGSYTREHGGTGLGLAIVKNLLSLMDGTIHVSSIPGEGSTFVLRIQFEKAEELQIFENKRGLKVYTIFDDEQMETFLTESVESMGGNVSPCTKDLENQNMERDALVFIEASIYSPDYAQKIHTVLSSSGSRAVWVGKIGESAIKSLRKNEKEAAVLVYPFRRSDLVLLFEQSDTDDEDHDSRSSRRKTRYEKTVLVAEDDKNNQLLIKRIFEKWHYRVIIASDGQETVEAFSVHHPDIIVMDVQMPKMDGIDTTRTIRQIPDGRHVPILALTAHALEGFREQCLAAGMNDYIAKPFNAPELLNKVEALLNVKKKGQILSDQSLRDDDAVLLSEIIDTYASLLTDSLETESFEHIADIAKRLKKEIESFGMQKLEALCFKVVLAARNKNSSKLKSLICDLERYKR